MTAFHSSGAAGVVAPASASATRPRPAARRPSAPPAPPAVDGGRVTHADRVTYACELALAGIGKRRLE